jgi:hypothetical protein
MLARNAVILSEVAQFCHPERVEEVLLSFVILSEVAQFCHPERGLISARKRRD